MSFEYFIADKILKNNKKGIKVSKPIMRISMISIALTIVVNLITIAVVTGFQNEIRKKIVGFNAPLFIMKDGNKNIYEADPIHLNQEKLKEIKKIKGVKSVSPIIYKPALIRSDKFTLDNKETDGKKIVKQDVTGVVLKGVDQNYPLTFFKIPACQVSFLPSKVTNKKLSFQKKYVMI